MRRNLLVLRTVAVTIIGGLVMSVLYLIGWITKGASW